MVKILQPQLWNTILTKQPTAKQSYAKRKLQLEMYSCNKTKPV